MKKINKDIQNPTRRRGEAQETETIYTNSFKQGLFRFNRDYTPTESALYLGGLEEEFWGCQKWSKFQIASGTR